MRPNTTAIALLFLSCVASSAYAIEPDPGNTVWTRPRTGDLAAVDAPASSPPSAPSDLALSGYVGGFGSNAGGGPMVGAAATWRTGVLQFGFAADAGSAILDYSYFGYGAAAGIGLRSRSGWQFDALVVGGIHHYEGFGRGFLTDDPGARATLPFAGLRAGPGFAFGSGSTHFVIGVLGFAETDLASRVVAYEYHEDGWLTESYAQQSSTRTVWTGRAGLALQLGISHDLL